GVVLEKHPQTEAAFQIGLQRPAVEARGVRVLERAVACQERARRLDADDVATRCRSTQRSHHPRHPLDDVLVAALAFGRQPAALQWMQVVAEHHTLDLRAAEVDPDDHAGLGLPHAARSHVLSPVEEPMPYAEGRVVHDADSHVVETPDWLVPYADPDLRDRLAPLFVAAVKPGEETYIDQLRCRHADPAERAKAEVEQARAMAAEVSAGGAKALLVPSACPATHSPSHTGLFPVWAQAEEAGLPILFHVGGGGKLIDPTYFKNGLPLVTDFPGGTENFRSVDFMAIPFAPM